jgi:YbbR domain-containing protein
MSDESSRSLGARLIGLVVDNWSIKLVSLVVSIFLYVILHGGSDSQRTIDVDVIAQMPHDPERILLTTLPPRVHVTVQGPRGLLDDLPNTIDPITVDLTKEPGGLRFEDVTVKLPTGVKKLHVVPPYQALRWDVRATKRVRVEPYFNAPPEGLAIKSLTIDPSMITISGPKTHIDLVQKLRTNALDLTHASPGIHTQTLSIDVLSYPELSGVELDTETVQAHYEIVPEEKTRTFANLPIVVLKGKGVTLRPQKVTVVVTCPPRRADELTADGIVPKIDLDALGPDFAKKGPEEADVKVDEIVGCSELSVTPPRVTVTK